MAEPGAVVDEVDYEIERGKIREFARATRTEDAVHSTKRLQQQRDSTISRQR